MSDNENVAAPSSKFTDREMQLLAWAMQSLKSGAPEIDYEKLARLAGMTNHRSAGNAWAKIKLKLAMAEDGAPVSTPKKAAGGRKKAAATAADGEDVETTPKKSTSPRKRAAKKQEVDGQGSPRKRGRPRKTSDDEEKSVKNESDSPKDAEPEENASANDSALEGGPVKKKDVSSETSETEEV